MWSPTRGAGTWRRAPATRYSTSARPNARLEEVLGEEDFAALDLDSPDRSLFTSFGSCSWREPVDDLQALGLVA